MRRQRKFSATSQGQSGNRHGDRLARCLQLAQPLAQPEEVIERDAIAFGRRGRHDHVIGGFKLRQIRASTKCRRLAGSDDDTCYAAFRQPIGKPAQFLDRRIREDVHRPARHVEDEVQDPISILLDSKLLQFRRFRHRTVSVSTYRSLVYYWSCMMTISHCIAFQNKVH